MSNKKNLVIGAVRGYSFQQLKPFVISLLQTGYTGDVCLLYKDLSQETREELKRLGVLLVPLDYRGSGSLNSWSRFWGYLKPLIFVAGSSEWGRYMMKMITPMQTSRFYNYKDFLNRHKNDYQNVLLTDVRDIFFQADPFANFSRTKVQCYEEDVVLADERQFNLPWVVSLFGEHAADTFLDRKILCSGTILGPVDEMILYLNAFESILKKANDIGRAGSDQGLHNYLIRTRYANHVDIVENGEEEVLTVLESNIPRYRVDESGIFVNKEMTIIPIIHQYDRNPALELAMKNRLRDNEMQ